MSKSDDTFTCGVIEAPNKYIKKSKYPAKVLSKHFALLIGAGNGCDELLEDDTPEEEEKLEEMISSLSNSPEFMEKVQRAFKIIHEG